MLLPLLPALCQGQSAEPSTQNLLPDQGEGTQSFFKTELRQDSPFWQRDLLHVGLASCRNKPENLNTTISNGKSCTARANQEEL